MTLSFWGVRGSLTSGARPDEELIRLTKLLHRYEDQRKKDPKTHHDKFVESFLKSNKDLFSLYGSHTICLEVATEKNNIIIDGGSGMLRLASKLRTRTNVAEDERSKYFLYHFHGTTL